MLTVSQICKKLAEVQTSQKKNGGLTEREAADEVYGKLKKKGDRFVRLMNPHNLDGGFIEINDEEALKSKFRCCRREQLYIRAYNSISILPFLLLPGL